MLDILDYLLVLQMIFPGPLLAGSLIKTLLLHNNYLSVFNGKMKSDASRVKLKALCVYIYGSDGRC